MGGGPSTKLNSHKNNQNNSIISGSVINSGTNRFHDKHNIYKISNNGFTVIYQCKGNF